MGQSSIDNLLLRPGRFPPPDSPESVVVLTSEADEPTLVDSQVDAEGQHIEYQDFEDIIDDTTNTDSFIELNTPHDSSDSDRGPSVPQVRSNSLMSVLSGNRISNKAPLEDPSSGLSSIAESDLNTEDLRILEQKVYKSGKIVSLTEVLGRPKCKLLGTKLVQENIARLEALMSAPPHKGISMKDVLGQKSKPKYLITLKVDREALAFFKKFENPLKARGNTTFCRSKGRFSDLVHPVTLKLNSAKLRELTANVDFSKPKKSQNLLFHSMMKSSASNTVRLTPLQKLKELMPPQIPKFAFHVKEETNAHMKSEYLSALSKRQRILTEVSNDVFDFSSTDLHERSQPISITPVTMSNESYETSFREKCDLNKPLFAYVYALEATPDLRQELWTMRLQPNTIDTLLILEHNQKKLRNWLLNAFSRLKNQSFNGSRDAKKKQQRRNKFVYNEFNSFIVPDDYGSDTEEEIFTPILIIHGKTGSGKSSSVYAAMNELDGYIHEMNAGQVRSRREIAGTLKELCTTHLLHGKSTEGDFKKGVVLLEDCDILFEQDRTFWTAVQEVLDITRRPIIITCTDISVVPRQIFHYAKEENAIIDLDENCVRDQETMKTFLWACCFSMHFRLSEDLLEHLVKENGSDIRKSLLSCQAICLGSLTGQSDLNSKVVYDVLFSSVSPNSTLDNETLQSLNHSLELISLGDVIETNSFTQIRHENIANEFIDISYLDESSKLKQPLMPHERQISSFFERSDYKTDQPPLTSNNLRDSINAFIASRSKPLSGHLQELYDIRDTMRTTRSIIDSDIKPWVPDTTGIPDGSLSIYLAPTHFVLDLAPFCRYWNELQKCLDKVDPSTKNHIRWRDFQDKSNSIKW